MKRGEGGEKDSLYFIFLTQTSMFEVKTSIKICFDCSFTKHQSIPATSSATMQFMDVKIIK